MDPLKTMTHTKRWQQARKTRTSNSQITPSSRVFLIGKCVKTTKIDFSNMKSILEHHSQENEYPFNRNYSRRDVPDEFQTNPHPLMMS